MEREQFISMFMVKTISEEETFSILSSCAPRNQPENYLLSKSYYHYAQAYHAPITLKIRSIAVYRRNALIALLPMIAIGQHCSLHGQPCFFLYFQQIDLIDVPAFQKALSRHLAQEFEGYTIVFRPDKISVPSMYSSIVNAHVTFTGLVDLQANSDVAARFIRKSYRSLINWGNANLSICRVEKNPSLPMEEFKQLHIRVAKRQTRSQETWDLQAEMIDSGNAFLVLGYYESDLVTGIFVQEELGAAFYGVAASRRDLMEDSKLPLGHAMIASGISIARERGNKWFVLGDVSSLKDDQKAVAIATFKRGFASEIQTAPVLEVRY